MRRKQVRRGNCARNLKVGSRQWLLTMWLLIKMARKRDLNDSMLASLANQSKTLMVLSTRSRENN